MIHSPRGHTLYDGARPTLDAGRWTATFSKAFAPPGRRVAAIAPWAVCVVGMSPQRRTRTLRLADGGAFRIGPGTVSVHVSTLPIDPPAMLLHVNRSCGCLELPADPSGNTPPPMRLDAARVLEIVQAINADRQQTAERGGKTEPPVELPPTFATTAKHLRAWRQQSFPFTVSPDAVGYPGTLPETTLRTLWVARATGRCVVEIVEPKAGPRDIDHYRLEDMTPAAAADWLIANGYGAVPATLHVARAKRGKSERRPRPATGND